MPASVHNYCFKHPCFSLGVGWLFADSRVGGAVHTLLSCEDGLRFLPLPWVWLIFLIVIFIAMKNRDQNLHHKFCCTGSTAIETLGPSLRGIL